MTSVSESTFETKDDFPTTFVAGTEASCCGWERRTVHVHRGTLLHDTAMSAFIIIDMISKYADNDRQFRGILAAAGIQPDAKRVDVVQMGKVINIFHNVMGDEQFPGLE